MTSFARRRNCYIRGQRYRIWMLRALPFRQEVCRGIKFRQHPRYIIKQNSVAANNIKILGLKIDLRRKRTYEIEKERLIDYYDSEVVANDELLTKYLAKNKEAVLGEIIATIQKEQNDIIRKSPYPSHSFVPFRQIMCSASFSDSAFPALTIRPALSEREIISNLVE